MIAKHLESQSCLIERRPVLFRFRYMWACVAVDDNIGRGRYPESVGWIIELLGRRNLVPVVVGP